MLFLAHSASAEAWVQPRGKGQVITTIAVDTASKGYDDSGQLKPLTQDWKIQTAQIYGEYGLSNSVTLIIKAQAQNLDTAYAQGTSNGPYELGLRYKVLQNDHQAIALGVSAEGFSRSSRNNFDTTISKGNDLRASLAAGQSFNARFGHAFVEASIARQFRQAEADQWRYGLTYGLKPDEHSMWLLQGFGGQTDRQAGHDSQWHVVQASYVNHLNRNGDLKGQLGLKYTIAGNNVPAMGGLFIAIWKEF